MSSHLRPATVLFAVMTVLCGVVYPLAVCGVASLVFPVKASGSIVESGGKPVGSSLIGQSFTSPQYFWGRPSATGPMPNNASGSSGSNFGPNNPAQIDAVKARIAALKAADPSNTLPIPVDLVTASGSGLDPEISVGAALYQASRVATTRHLTTARVLDLIESSRQPQYFGFFGEPRVNVLALNLALDLEKSPPQLQAKR